MNAISNDLPSRKTVDKHQQLYGLLVCTTQKIRQTLSKHPCKACAIFRHAYLEIRSLISTAPAQTQRNQIQE